MEAVNAKEAHKFFSTTKFLSNINTLCYNKCVVDFQTKDIGAMEKECALACIRKQMTIYPEMLK